MMEQQIGDYYTFFFQENAGGQMFLNVRSHKTGVVQTLLAIGKGRDGPQITLIKNTYFAFKHYRTDFYLPTFIDEPSQ